jgi:hypothetical protein
MNRILQKLRALLSCSSETNSKVFALLDEVRDLGGKVTLPAVDSDISYRCTVPALSAGHRIFVVTDLTLTKEAYSALKSSRLTVLVEKIVDPTNCLVSLSALCSRITAWATSLSLRIFATKLIKAGILTFYKVAQRPYVSAWLEIRTDLSTISIISAVKLIVALTVAAAAWTLDFV